MSWIKKELHYLKESAPQIANGFLIFLLMSSGLGCAILLRYLNLTGTIIAFLSVIIQLIALILSYFSIRKYLTEAVEKTPQTSKKKGI